MLLNTKLTLIACFFAAQMLPAQILVPYLGANGKYGYANEQGELLIQPEYDILNMLSADAFGTNASKNKAAIFLLRNGMTVPGDNLRAVPVVNCEDKSCRTPDTLRHLVLLQSYQQMTLVNLKTRQTLSFSPSERVEVPRWFSMRSKDNHILTCNFHQGICRIFDEKGQVNFVDTDLKPLLPRHYPAGAIAFNYLVLGDEKQQTGVADRNGKIRISFVWDKLEPAGRDGYFLVNNAEHFSASTSKHERAGMLNAEGKLVIDTAYQIIQPIGNEYLIVRTKERSGLMDYAGKWVLPYEDREITHAFDDFFIVKPLDGKANVLNLKGEKQLKSDYTDITVRPNGFGEKPYLMLYERPLLGIADSSFEVLFIDTLMSISNPYRTYRNQKTAPQFVVVEGSSNYKNDRQGVRDRHGKKILPGIYDAISLLPHVDEDLYLVKKDSLFGVFDTDGKVVFSLNFKAINVEEGSKYKPDTIVWAMPAGAKLYSAFDQRGKRLPYPDHFMPGRNRTNLMHPSYDQELRKHYVALMDGTRLYDKTLYDNGMRLRQFPTSDGGFLVDKSKENVQVLDAFFKEIVPEGFVVPKQLYDENNLRITGLLPVYQLPQGYALRKPKPPVTTKPGLPLPSGNVDEDMPVLEDLQPAVADESYPDRPLPKILDACGIINAKGEWVVKPKAGVHFLPMSYFLVKEFSMDENPDNYVSPKGLKLHRVNQPDKTDIEVSRLRYQKFDDQNNHTMLFGKVEKGEMRMAFFSEKGEQLTEFNILRGGGYLQARNLVTIRNKKGGETDLILDAQGKVITDLGDLVCDDIYNRNSRWSFDFLTAQKRGTEQFGLIDSTGKVLLPFRFKYLDITETGHLLSSLNAEGNRELRNWQGELLATSLSKNNFYCYKTASGYLLATNTASTFVISPEGELAHTLPYKVRSAAGMDWYSHLARFGESDTSPSFWVDLATGREYRE